MIARILTLFAILLSSLLLVACAPEEKTVAVEDSGPNYKDGCTFDEFNEIFDSCDITDYPSADYFWERVDSYTVLTEECGQCIIDGLCAGLYYSCTLNSENWSECYFNDICLDSEN